MNMACRFGFHDFPNKPIKLAQEKVQIWNAENVDKEIDYCYGLFQCSKCGLKFWRDVTFDYYYRLTQESGLYKLIPESERDIQFQMREEALKRGWKMDLEYTLVGEQTEQKETTK